MNEDNVSKKSLINNPRIAFKYTLNSHYNYLIAPYLQDPDVLSLQCENMTLASVVLQQDPDWAATDATQRLDVLTIRSENAMLMLAHELAHYKKWAMSPIAQNETVLKLKVDNVMAVPVAKALATYSSQWPTTPAAQEFSILSIQLPGGTTVASTLASNSQTWGLSPAAQDPAILELSGGVCYSTAHHLAASNNEWSKTDAAQDIKILNMRHNNGQSVAEVLSKKGALTSDSWVFNVAAQRKDVAELPISYDDSEPLIFYAIQRIYEFNDNSSLECAFDVLLLKDNNGSSVAHCIATLDKNWFNRSALARSKKILSLTNASGYSVAMAHIEHHPKNALLVTTAALVQGIPVRFRNAYGVEYLTRILTDNPNFITETVASVFDDASLFYGTQAYSQVLICLLATVYELASLKQDSKLNDIKTSLESTIHAYFKERPTQRNQLDLEDIIRIFETDDFDTIDNIMALLNKSNCLTIFSDATNQMNTTSPPPLDSGPIY